MKITKVLGILTAVIAVLLASVLAVGGMYLKKQYNRTTYYSHTTINGVDVSEKTPDEVMADLVASYSSPSVTVNENGEEAITGQLADYGYEIDEEALKADLDSDLAKEKSSLIVLIGSLMDGNSFQVSIPFVYSAETLKNKVNAAALPTERKPSVDAEMKFNKEKKEYYIEPEVYGNEFSDEEFQEYVKGQIDTYLSAEDREDSLTMDFPEELYILPEATANDIEMNNLCNIYNRFCKAQITYQFGSKEEKIDWDQIQKWLYIEDGEGKLDEEAIYSFVMDLGARYNTRHYDRRFTTSLGEEIVIPSSENDYGYTVDEDGEFSQLLSDINGNKAVEREPVYFLTNAEYENPLFYHRDGYDDLAGTYVEVNLTLQHLWCYVDYGLVVESDVVSGCVTRNAETKTGVFPIAYKESPSILRGDNAADGYETKVQYWMPFYEGQGLHDATWRGAFGGSIYVTNGSHGCINLPYSVAEQIYYNIDAGVPIIIYK